MSDSFTPEQIAMVNKVDSVIHDYKAKLISQDDLWSKLSEIIRESISPTNSSLDGLDLILAYPLEFFETLNFLEEYLSPSSSDGSSKQSATKTETAYKKPMSIPDVMVVEPSLSCHTKVIQDVSALPWAS